MRQAGIGPWLADIAANVLAITLVVLIVLARMAESEPPGQPAETLTPRLVAPLGGAAAVELLRQRLLPGASGYLDVTGDPRPSGPVTVLFVLDPGLYPQAVAGLSGTWQELTVPQALKTPDNAWDPGFLALAPLAADPDRFRTALQLLLAENSRAAQGDSAAALGGDGPQTRFQRWFAAALDVMGFLALSAALAALWGLRRWAVKA
jgi:hypothetical protein